MNSSPGPNSKRESSSHRRFTSKDGAYRGRDKEDKGATSPRLTLKFQHIKTKENRSGNDSHTPQKPSKHTGREGHYKAYSVTLGSEEPTECKRAKYTPPLSPANSTSSQDSDLYDPKIDGIGYNKSDKKSSLFLRGRDSSHSSVFGNKMENSHHSGKENEKRPLVPVTESGRFSQFEDISDDEDAKDSNPRKEEPMEVGSNTVSTSSSAPTGGALPPSSSRLRVSPTPSRSTQPSSSTQHTTTAPSLHIPPQHHPSSLSHIPSSTSTTAAQPTSSTPVTTTSTATASHMSRRPIYSQHKTAASSDHTGGNSGHHHHGISSSHSTHAPSSSSTSTSSSKGGGSHSGDSHKHHTPVYAPASSSSGGGGGAGNIQHVSTSSSSNLQQQQTLSEQEKLKLESQRLYQFEDEFSDKEDEPSRLRPEKTPPKSASDTSSNSSSLVKDSLKLSPKFDSSIKDSKSPKSDGTRERLSPKYSTDSKLFGYKSDKEQQSHRTFPRLDHEAKAEGKVSPKPERYSPKLDKEKENGRLSTLSSSVKPDSSSGNGNGNNRSSPKLDREASRLSPKSENSNGSSGGGSGRSSPKVPPLKIILPVKTTAPTAASDESLKSLLMKPALPYVLNPTQDGRATTTSGDPSSVSETTTTTSSSGESIVSSQPSSSTAVLSGAGGNEAKEVDEQPAPDGKTSPTEGAPAGDNGQSGASSSTDQSKKVCDLFFTEYLCEESSAIYCVTHANILVRRRYYGHNIEHFVES